MIAYICNKCKKIIEEDDIEAIEVKAIESRMLFSTEKEDFKLTKINEFNENQNLHYCGDCKHDFYDYL